MDFYFAFFKWREHYNNCSPWSDILEFSFVLSGHIDEQEWL